MRRIRKRHILAACGCAAAVWCVWSLLSDSPPSGALRGSPEPDGTWVATFNVNFERVSPETVSALLALDADVVFLQETHGDWRSIIEQSPLVLAYPHRFFLDRPSEGGMGVLSRHPLRDVSVSEPSVVQFPAVCLRVDTPTGALAVLSLHLLPPLDEQGSLWWGYWTTPPQRLAELEHHLSCGGLGPFDLIVGDLNEGEGPTLSALEDAGFVESQRVHSPPEPTWHWDVGALVLRGRPDHILVSDALRVAAVQVVTAQGASDHAPLRVQVAR